MQNTRTDNTKKQYYKKAVSLMKKAYKEATKNNKNQYEKHKKIIILNGVENECLDLVYTVAWAAKNWSNTLMHSSWIYYRATLNYMAELSFINGEITLETKEKINKILKTYHGADKSEIDVRTSRKKKKSFSKNDQEKVFDYLSKNKGKWSNPLTLWIKATISTGLRPIEWKKSVYNEENNSLIVLNAKNTNNRSHGEYRTINLDHLENNEIAVIVLHLTITKKIINENKWDEYYIGCSNLLKYITSKIFKDKERRPTLYSARHQYSANLKASNCKKNEIATLMGHKSEDTATAHYGKKIHGTRGKKPNVDENELKRVSVNNKPKFSFDDGVKK